MPCRPNSATVVFLTEVLEVKGSALEEYQIWSLLYQSAEALHDRLLAGEAQDGRLPTVYVMPDTLCLSSDGSVLFDRCVHQMYVESKYCPFEWQAGLVNVDDSSVEKMWTYGLGMTAYMGADYSLPSDEALHVAEELSACLCTMVEHEAARRATLLDVIEACFKYANRHMTQPFCHYTQELYKSVLGSPPNEVETFSLEDYVSRHNIPDQVSHDGYRARKRKATEGTSFSKLLHLDVAHESPQATSTAIQLSGRPSRDPRILSGAIMTERRTAFNPSTGPQVLPAVSHRHGTTNSPLWDILRGVNGPGKSTVDSTSTDSFLHATYQRIIDRRQKLMLLSEGLGIPEALMQGTDTIRPVQVMPTVNNDGLLARVNGTLAHQSLHSSSTSLTHGSFHPNGDGRLSASLIDEDLVDAKAGIQQLVDVSQLLENAQDAGSSSSVWNGNVMEDPIVQEAYLLQQQTPFAPAGICWEGEDRLRRAEKVPHSTSPVGPRHQQNNGISATSSHRLDTATVIKPRLNNPIPVSSQDQCDASSLTLSSQPKIMSATPPNQLDTNSVDLPRQQDVNVMSSLRPDDGVVAKKKFKRAFDGPESVFNAGQHIRDIPFYIPGKPKGKVASAISSAVLHKSVMVTLLSGERIRLHCTGSCTGGQILKAIVEEIDMKESYYFGITHIKDAEHFFIDEDTKLQKVAPDYWKKDAHSSYDTLCLYVRVKYYVDNVQFLRHPSSRHRLYLQLRADILEEHLFVDADDDLMLLAGLALQAEYGEQALASQNASYFLPQHYLPARVLRQQDERHWKALLSSYHAKNKELSVFGAETKFIETCQRFLEYGMHFYRVYLNEAAAAAHVNTLNIGANRPPGLIWLGLSAKGLGLCEFRGPGHTSATRLSWNAVQKLSFNRKKITIMTRATNEKPRPSKTSYFTDGYRTAKYLVLFASTLQRYRRQTVTFSQGSRMSVTALESSSEATNNDIWKNTALESGEAADMPKSTLEWEALKTTPDYTKSLPLQTRATKVPAPAPETGNSYEARRKIVVATISTDSETESLGINLVGMNGPERHGVFVAEVMPGGPAATNSKVMIGDRLVAINGQTVEGTSRKEAAELLSNAKGQVQLVLSRTMAATGPEFDSHLSKPVNIEATGVGAFSYEHASDASRTETAFTLPHSARNSKEDVAVDKTRSQSILGLGGHRRAAGSEVSSDVDMGSGREDEVIEPAYHVTGSFGSIVHSDVSPIKGSNGGEKLTAGLLSAFQKPIQRKRNALAYDQNDAGTRSYTEVCVDTEGRVGTQDCSDDEDEVQARRGRSVEKGLANQEMTLTDARVLSSSGLAPSPVSVTAKRQAYEYHTTGETGSSLTASGSTHAISKRQKSSTGSSKSNSGKSLSRTGPTFNARSDASGEAGSDEEVSIVMTGPSTKAAKSISKSDTPLSCSSNGASVATSDVASFASSPSLAPLMLKTPIDDHLNVGDRYDVTLVKTNGNLGLNVTGGTNTSVKHGGIYVKSLVPRGQADMCARIRLGDRVLSVNGTDLTAVTHRLAVETLRNAETPVHIVLERGEPPAAMARPSADPNASLQGLTPSLSDTRLSSDGASMSRPTLSPASTAESVGDMKSNDVIIPLSSSTPTVDPVKLFDEGMHFEVHLRKDPSGFGFSILGGRTHDVTDPKKSLVRVKKVFPLGAAAREGSLQVGDVIMEVNGKSLEGLTHAEAVNVLRSCSQEVKLSMCRVDTRVLSPLTESMINASSRQPSAVSPALYTESPCFVMNQKTQDFDNVSISTADQSSSSVESEETVIAPDANKQRLDQSVTSQPTPIRELDNILQANTTLTSINSSDSQTPSRATSQRNSGRLSLMLQRRPSAAGVMPASLAERLRIALNNSRASSRRSSMSDDQNAEKQAQTALASGSGDSSDISRRSSISAPGAIANHPDSCIIDIKLKKNENGSLGFSVYGSTKGCFVKSILQDPALVDGRLCVGDRLLTVNGKDMTDVSQAVAVQCLRQAPELVTIRVQRNLSTSSPAPAKPPRTPQIGVFSGKDAEQRPVEGATVPAGSSSGRGEDVHSSSNSDSDDSDHISGMGDNVSLTSSSESQRSVGDGCEADVIDTGILPLDIARLSLSAQPLVVSSRDAADLAQEEAAAAVSSSLAPGADAPGWLLSVDDVAAAETPDSDKKEVEAPVLSLDAANSEEMSPDAEVSKPVPAACDESETKLSVFSENNAAAVTRKESIRLLPTEDVIRVTLTKPAGGGLGFSINCEEHEGHLYAFVKAVTAGGVAEADGRLHAGDRLLKVNDVNIAGFTQPKAVALIRQLQGAVHLVLARQQSRQGSPLPDAAPGLTESSSSEDEDVSVLLASSLKTLTDAESTGYGNDMNDSGPVFTTLSSETDEKGAPLVGGSLQRSRLSDDNSDEEQSSASDLDFDLPDDSIISSGRTSADAIGSTMTGGLHIKIDSSLQSVVSKELKSSGQESTEDAADSDDSLSEILKKHFLVAATGQRSPLVQLPSVPLSMSDDVEGELSDTQDWQQHTKVKDTPLRRSNQASPWYGGESTGIPLFGRLVTSEWISDLPLVKVGSKGLYAGSSLDRAIAQLRFKIGNDEPSEEFKAMKNIKPTDECQEGKMPYNKPLNRFRNVLPYDFNRVILSGDDDYINASHVRVPLGEDMSHYIACQGPLPHTTSHFWQMIVEQKVQVIAMLTLDVENGKVKCHRYWPDSPDTPLVVSERYQVALTKVYDLEHFDVRYVTIRDQLSSLVHQTVHLNYKTWPDRGVPSSALPLLEFLRLVHEFHVSGPIVLHCSAGIGRTGAVIALDIVVSCIEKDLKFDINQIIIDLRKQRQGMIQTKDQYLFCYDACMQVLECIK